MPTNARSHPTGSSCQLNQSPSESRNELPPLPPDYMSVAQRPPESPAPISDPSIADVNRQYTERIPTQSHMPIQDYPTATVVDVGFQEPQRTALVENVSYCGNFAYGFLSGMFAGPYGFIGLYFIDERRKRKFFMIGVIAIQVIFLIIQLSILSSSQPRDLYSAYYRILPFHS